MSDAWRSYAKCRGVDPEVFFPDPPGCRTGRHEEAEEAAKAICRECPVRAQCLEWALANRERDGILGGCTAEEREDIRFQRRHLRIRRRRSA